MQNNRLLQRVPKLSLLVNAAFALSVATSICASVSPAWSQTLETTVQADQKFRQQILSSGHAQELKDLFYSSDLRPSLEKVKRFQDVIKKSRDDVYQNIVKFKRDNEGMSIEKAQNKAAEDDLVVAYNLILGETERLTRLLNDEERFFLIAQACLDIEFALRTEGNPVAIKRFVSHFAASLKPWTISRESVPQKQALNLVDQRTRHFVSLSEIKANTASELNPQSETRWYEERDIEHTDVKKAYLGGANALYSGLQVELPKDNEFHLKSVKKTQSHPKLNVFTVGSDGKKVAYKLKLTREVHSGVTAAALSSTLGFYNDVAKEMPHVKVYLDGMSFEDFKREWHSYYTDFEITDYLEKIGNKGDFVSQDRDGKRFVVFQQGMIEAKVDGLVRLGSYPYWKNSHAMMREIRGLQLFNMWVFNADLKEQENNKLILKQSPDKKTYQLFAMQSDVGYTFGNLDSSEAVANFSWTMAKKVDDPKQVAFEFRTFQDPSGLNFITFDDLKWMARKIARLSRKQIQDAVELGNWPEPVSKLLVEKLISRRNEIVKIFDLQREGFALLPFDREITTRDGAVVKGVLKQVQYPGYPLAFNFGFDDVRRQLITPLAIALESQGEMLVGRLGSISVDPVSIGLDSNFIANVLLNVNREVQRNLEASSEDESYIVRDTLKIGFELGGGVVIGGRAQTVLTHQLVYTTKTEEQAVAGKNFFSTLLLPMERWNESLPKKNVLITELTLEGGGYFKTEDMTQTIIPIGLQVNASKVLLYRSIISGRDPAKLRFFEDSSLYNEIAIKVFARLGILKIPLAKEVMAKGNINRTIYEIDREEMARNSDLRERVRQAVYYGRIQGLQGMAKTVALSSKFTEKQFKFSLLGVIGSQKIRRVDEITRTVVAQDGTLTAQTPQYNLQISDSREKSWSFFGNAESFTAKTFLISSPSTRNGEIKEPVLQVSYDTRDAETKSKELAQKYIEFANQAAGAKVIDFDPFQHSANNIWGDTQTLVNFVYSPEVLQFMLESPKFDLEKFKWQALKSIDVKNVEDSSHLKQLVKYLEKARTKSEGVMRMQYLTRALSATAWKSSGTFQGRVLGLLHKELRAQLGKDAVYMKVVIANRAGSENVFPSGVPLTAQMGVKPRMADPVTLLLDTTPLELWSSL